MLHVPTETNLNGSPFVEYMLIARGGGGLELDRQHLQSNYVGGCYTADNMPLGSPTLLAA